MQFGVYTFVETRRDPRTGEPVDLDRSFADLIEQIELADRVGLDVFGVGEHHRADYAVSAPAVLSGRRRGAHQAHSLNQRGHRLVV